MRSLICAFVVRIGYKTRYYMPLLVKNRFFPKRKFQDINKPLCVTSYTLKQIFDDAAHIIHDLVLPDHCRFQNT